MAATGSAANPINLNATPPLAHGRRRLGSAQNPFIFNGDSDSNNAAPMPFDWPISEALDRREALGAWQNPPVGNSRYVAVALIRNGVANAPPQSRFWHVVVASITTGGQHRLYVRNYDIAGRQIHPLWGQNTNIIPQVLSGPDVRFLGVFRAGGIVTVHIFMRTWAATGRRPREGARFHITMNAAAQYVHQELLPAVNHHGYRPARANMDEAAFVPNEDLLNMA